MRRPATECGAHTAIFFSPRRMALSRPDLLPVHKWGSGDENPSERQPWSLARVDDAILLYYITSTLHRDVAPHRESYFRRDFRRWLIASSMLSIGALRGARLSRSRPLARLSQ